MATQAGATLLGDDAAEGRSDAGRGPWIVAGAAIASAALVLLLLGQPIVAVGFLGGTLAVGGLYLLARRDRLPVAAPETITDWALTRAAIESDAHAVALTDRDGRLV